MNLIWQDNIDFFKSKGINLSLKEGYYWFDRQIIKAYDTDGALRKIARIKVDDDLNIKLIKIYKNKKFKIESWHQTLLRKNDRLQRLENRAVSIVKTALKYYKDYKPIVLVSGGKDSSYIEHVVNKVLNSHNYNVIFNNTSNETHYTYKYVKENYNNLRILSPNQGFYELIRKYNSVPSRFNRFCCTHLKENVTINQLDNKEKLLFFMGMRRSESSNRSTYKVRWKNKKWKGDNWQAILPILNVNDEDIWLLMLKNNIPINPMYKFGFSRVGCVHCPYRTNYELVLTEYFLSNYYNRFQNLLEEDFISNGKAASINCSLQEYKNGAWRGGRVRDEVTDDIVQEFAKHKGIDNLKIAKKYFNNKCSDCNKNIKKNDVALSLKYFGRQSSKLFCINCLSKMLNRSKKELKEDINRFLEEGCNLF